MLKAYEALSVILAPPAIALYMTLIFSFYSPIGLGSIGPTSSIAIGMAFLVMIPFLSVYLFSRRVINLERKKRTLPYTVSIISYIIASALFWYLDSKIMFLISLSYFSVVSSLFIINNFWKISAHAAGAAGPTTALVYVFGMSMAPVYLITLLIMWVRLKLKIHSILQVTAGSVIAIIITSLIYTILW